MAHTTTRTASLNDLDILLDFEKGIITTERPFDPTIQNGDIHYYDIAQMIASPDVEVVVVESEGKLIGSGYARIENSKPYLKHQKHAYMGFMYVSPDHRGKGVNQKIIDALQQWSIKQGVTEFRLEVYSDNLNAIKAYEKVGFSKLLVTMRMELPAKTK